MAYNIIVGRDDTDRMKFGDKGTVFIGKSYVTMGQTVSLANNVFLDVNRPHVMLCTGKRGSGKCLVGNTLITLGDGSVKPIKDLENDNNLVYGLNERLKIKKTEKSEFFKRSVNKILKVKLRSGKEIELTPEHPLFTIKGWKPAEGLTIGSRIATPRKQEVFGKDVMEDYKIRILAYLLAEGHTKGSWVLFSNSDEVLINDFKNSVSRFDKNLNVELHGKHGCYRVSNKNNRYGFRKNSIKEWLKSLGCYGFYAKEKWIPQEIFKLPKEQLALFLNILFSCNGSVYKNKKGNGSGWEISYSSSSNKMIKQVQHLLLRFGVLSRLRDKKVKCNGKLFDTWEIVVNPANCIDFIKEIGFFGEKEEKQEICLLEVVDIKRNPNVDTIPKEMWDLYRPENWAKIGRAVGYKCPKDMRERIRYSPSRQTLLQISEVEQNNALYLLATSDVFWDEITSIEQLEGDFEVYDISVPKIHNFVANDIIVHNSYTQGVIAEQISSMPEDVKKNLSVIMFDTMGIFWTMKYPNKRDEKLLSEWGEAPKNIGIDVYIPDGFYDEYKDKGIPVDYGFSIKTSELNAGDWADVFDVKLTDPIGILIERIIGELEDHHVDYGIGEIITKIRQDTKSINAVRDACENRFLAANKWGLFKKQGISISDLLKPGKVSVIDLSIYARMSGEWKIKNLVVGLLSRKLLSERIGSRKFEELDEIEKGSSYFEERKKAEKPLVWIMIDECLPGNSEIITDKAHTPIKDIVKKFEKGEKFKVLGYDLKNQSYGYYDVTNVYKKGKRKNLKIITKSGKELICTENHRILTRNGFAPSLFAKEIGCPLAQHYDQNKENITARLLGYLLGDGWLSKTKIVGFAGKGNKNDLIKIKKDLASVGLKSSNIYTRKTKSKIKPCSGKDISVDGETIFIHASRKAYNFFKKYGVPEGKRILINYKIPKYISNASEKEKCEFLAGWMGADGCRATIDKNSKANLNPIRLSFNKDKKLEKNAFEFAEDIKKLFESIDIKISNIKKFKGNLRKDGVETIKIVLTIAKNLKNMVNFFEKIGYRYCENKEIRANKWLNYLKLKLNYVNNRRKIKLKIIKEYQEGRKKAELARKYSLPLYQVSCWTINKNKDLDVDKNFVKFDEWENKYCLNNVCYEEISNKKCIGEEEVYDISVDKVHNFVANGFIVHNCHQFLRKDEKTAASDALIALLREGRQPGISMILATQQPGIVHRDVLTQSDIVLAHRITAQDDISALNSMMQNYLLKDISKYMNELPDLKGSAIILDDNSERIYPVRIKPKVTWHGGSSPTAIKLSKKEELIEL